MIPDEIAQAVVAAGFEARDTAAPCRRIFTRGTCTLTINSDVTWTCYGQISGMRRLCWNGYTFDSLLAYLARDDDGIGSNGLGKKISTRNEAMT